MKIKLFAVIMTLVMLVSVFAGCAPAEPTEPNEPVAPVEPTEPTEPAETDDTNTLDEGITLTDMLGREVLIPAPAEKIVVTAAADCEILYAIGAGDKIVARGEYCNYPAEALDIPAISSGSEVNLEEIVALSPDLVVFSVLDSSPESVEALQQNGINVLVTDADTIEGVYEAITLLGAATGTGSDAYALTESMATAFEELKEYAPANEGKTAYFEVSPLEWGLWCAGADTFMDEIANMLGVTNVFAGVSGWAEISQEQVIEADPDYIITTTMYFGEGPTPVEELCSRAGWENMKAIKNGNVINADSDAITRPGPRLVEAGKELAEFFGK